MSHCPVTVTVTVKLDSRNRGDYWFRRRKAQARRSDRWPGPEQAAKSAALAESIGMMVTPAVQRPGKYRELPGHRSHGPSHRDVLQSPAGLSPRLSAGPAGPLA